MDPDSITGKDLHVQGLTERSVVELSDYLKILEIGAKHRTVAETNMNEVSSRSHAVFTLTIEQIQFLENAQLIGPRKKSKIHFIDLAGSERADSTGATGQRLKEGSMINQSLLSLGNVISALSRKTTQATNTNVINNTTTNSNSNSSNTTASHGYVPYRDSKLTYLLSDSLGGNSLTLMIACVTPTAACYEESVSTLRFAERAKKVTNQPHINLDPTSLRIVELEAEIKRLKLCLAQCTCKNSKKPGFSLYFIQKNLRFPQFSMKKLRFRCCGRVDSSDTILTSVDPDELLTEASQKEKSPNFKKKKQISPSFVSSNRLY
jgi:hypothetical protein